MKKLISAIIASAMAVTAIVPVFAADTFKDVNSKSYSWAYSYVEDMAERGLIKGYEDGTFRPGNSVSRMEAFALFARLMGSNSEVNADALNQAKEKYKDILAEYELSYAEGDVAFMLMRGVLAEDELNTYFEGKKKTEAMPRYEAAVLITKAMLGEQEAKKEVLVDMDYTDVSSIPKAAKQYVYYVTQNGIMSGMGDGAFSANTDVLRGQIAVMLSKTADTINYTFDSITISKIDESSKNIGIKDADGKEFTIGYSDDSMFFKNGEAVAPSQLRSGQKAVLTYVSDGNGTKLAFADVAANAVDERKSVIYKNYTTFGGTLVLNVMDPSNDLMQSYSLSDTAVLTADSKAVNINSLKSGDYVTIGISGDVVVEIDAMQKNAKINAVIEKISALGTITISSEDTEFDGMTLSLSQDVSIFKNGDTVGFSDLGRGDKATITLEYGIVTKVNATSATKTITGVLKSYTISDSPTITINRDGTDYTFDVPANVSIAVNGEKADLSDFKQPGITVTVTVESEVVKKITASNAAGTLTNAEITGTVVGTNDKTIIIQNSDEGGEVKITVSTNALTKIFVPNPYADYTVKKLKSGDFIRAYGGWENGFFVASTIMVTPVAE